MLESHSGSGVEKDRMSAKTRTFKLLALFGAILMLALSAGFAWAAADDFAKRGIVSQGVTLGGETLAGMTEDEASAVIEETVSNPLMQPVTVTFQAREFTLDPEGSLSVDVEAMLDLTGLPVADGGVKQTDVSPSPGDAANGQPVDSATGIAAALSRLQYRVSDGNADSNT